MGIIIKDGIQYGNQPDSYTKTETNTLLNAKQNTLTFDNTPTASSQNPVTSDGIKTALDGKVNTSDIYNALDKTTAGSTLDARQGKVLNDTVQEMPCLIVNCGTVSSLPTTVNDAKITEDMKCIDVILSNTWAEYDDWTATTTNGSVTISGTINGSTDVTLFLMKTR